MINEEDQRNDEIELILNLNINHNLTENDIKNIDVKSRLEHQIQIQKTKDSGWIFDKINSMKIRFYKTGELNGSSYVKTPLRSSALLIIKNDDQNCFLWSILPILPTCKNDHPSRVPNYRQNFDELNIECFDFTSGFRCGDVHIFEKQEKLSINMFELDFYQDKNNWTHNLIPIEISEKNSDRVVDLLLYQTNRFSLKNYMHF